MMLAVTSRKSTSIRASVKSSASTWPKHRRTPTGARWCTWWTFSRRLRRCTARCTRSVSRASCSSGASRCWTWCCRCVDASWEHRCDHAPLGSDGEWAVVVVARFTWADDSIGSNCTTRATTVDNEGDCVRRIQQVSPYWWLGFSNGTWKQARPRVSLWLI